VSTIPHLELQCVQIDNRADLVELPHLATLLANSCKRV
jgi:hypothetical protein